MDIRTELRELMETNNYSIAFVSTATGIAKSTISMWLNNTYSGNEKGHVERSVEIIRRKAFSKNTSFP